MKLNLLPTFTARLWTFLLSASLLIMMSGCGGSVNGGKPLGPNTPNKDGFIELKLINPAGQSTNVIPTGSYLYVNAFVSSDASGTPASNKLVTFTNSGMAGIITTPGGTASTDSNGNAQIELAHGVSGASGEITATVTAASSNKVTATIAFKAQ